MKKVLLIVSFLAAGVNVIKAQTYFTRTAKIVFNATAPSSPEKIEAVNNEVANVINAKTGEIRFAALIKSFKFERELMQEHFNEEYLESDKYPKADFTGTITNLNEINFSKDGEYKAHVTGKLQIHGITKEVNETGVITVKGNTVDVKARFSVKLADYNVSIGSMVADKVGKEAIISLESELTLK